MRNATVCLAAGLLMLCAAAGCKQAPKTGRSPEPPSARQPTDKPSKALICGKCGQIKGSELCCKKGQALCPKCNLVKGSPGCCQLPKGSADVELCTKCGFIKGSAVCCKTAGKAVCSKCGLVKGSPGCCRIK